jgi:hypothetical protein
MIQQLLDDLAAQMDRSVARQISALEERLRASPPRCGPGPAPREQSLVTGPLPVTVCTPLHPLPVRAM